GRMKSQHNVFLRYAGRKQLIGDRPVRAIVLDPDLATDNVEVNHRSMHASLPVPADMHDLIVVLVSIDDGFCINLAVGRLVTGILLDDPTGDFSISLYSIHFTMLRCW